MGSEFLVEHTVRALLPTMFDPFVGVSCDCWWAAHVNDQRAALLGPDGDKNPYEIDIHVNLDSSPDKEFIVDRVSPLGLIFGTVSEDTNNNNTSRRM